MISIDTNILFFAFDETSPHNPKAMAFLESLASEANVMLSEFVLAEFYRLIRNPAVNKKPLSAADAAAVITSYRSHPCWQIISFPPGEPSKFHDDLWRLASKSAFPYRRLYDARLALAVRSFSVTEFATANTKDFEGFGFRRVWNPLAN